MDEVLKQYDPLGNSRKYPYHMTDGFLEFWGQGAFFELEIQRHWVQGVWGSSYDWNSEGMEGFLVLRRCGISTGDRQECIPWKRLSHLLHQFANKAWTDDAADYWGSKICKDQSIRHVFVSICRRKPTNSRAVHQAPEAIMLQNILFFLSRENSHGP